jgi:uncharacterized protein (DUF608 family)
MRISRRRLFLGSAALPAGVAAASAAAGTPAPATGRSFRGPKLKEIAFPLGGIGTGTISLNGRGALRDWEIFNRPNKGGLMPYTFGAVRLAGGGLPKPAVRVLERELLPPYTGGSGLPWRMVSGLPRFREATFTGSYPFARIDFEDSRFPVQASLEAFNPMIPLETEESSLPVAVLQYSFTSRAKSKLDATVVFSALNLAGYDGSSAVGGRRAPFFGSNLNEFRREADLAGIFMTSRKYPESSPHFGSLALLTGAGDHSYRLEWEHPWWAELNVWWDELLEAGRFPNTPSKPSEDGFSEYASLASHFTLQPGETRQVEFVLGWHFPNVENYWAYNPAEKGYVFRNHYGARWKSAWEPTAYLLRNLAPLRERSRRYRDTLYA